MRTRLLLAVLALFGSAVAIRAGDQAAAVAPDTASVRPAAAAPQAERVRFNRDIRPIMAGTCFRCHGPDSSSRMAGMRLDLREHAISPRRNGTPIVPGNPDESLIVRRIFETNPARQMPPVSIHKNLSDEQKQTIRRWVAEGAEYEGHWAYQPLRRPPVPAGGTTNHPVDAFVRAELARAGLPASPQADRRTLIRRLYLDLTGLAPMPAEVDAFIKDTSPAAYERLVDRLLGSPRYAERQALYWLDAVRYADTSGFHGDNPYPVWPYRDYVLRAFRDNKPFDVFTREQLAGDLLPNATTEQKIASAFNRLNRVSGEGGLQEKEYLAKYGADRVRTVSSVWMGTTVGCAECHDHKFDPVLTKDFYALKAFFADLNETGMARDGGGRNGPDAWGVKLSLPTAHEQQQLDDLGRRLQAAIRQLQSRTNATMAERSTWEAKILSQHQAGELRWQFQRPVFASASRATLTVRDDLGVRVGSLLRFREKPVAGLVVATGENPDHETYTVTLKPGPGEWRSLGLEIARDDSLPGGYIARGGLGLELSEVEAELVQGAGKTRKVTFSIGSASGARGFQDEADASVIDAIDGDPKTAWAIGDFGTSASNPFLALQFSTPVSTTADSTLVIRLRHESQTRKATLGRFRVALSAGPAWPDDPARGGTVEEVAADPASEYLGLPQSVVRALTTPAGDIEAPQNPGRGSRPPAAVTADSARDRVTPYFQMSTPALAPLVAEVARLTSARARLEMGVTRVMVSEAMPVPRETRILPRGNWMDDSGAVVEPAIPEFLGRVNTTGRATRLDLANWLVSVDNPLTARVFVNRVWKQFFGSGLSSTLGDFGSQGEWPSHPDLLDWLASEFMQPAVARSANAHQWDVKHLIRTIVTSETYRQSSLPRPDAESLDPGNRLLARQNRFRVEAEVVRDLALQASGLLTEAFGGPSVRPYQPDGYLAALNYPRRAYSESYGPDLYRRGLYVFWQRTFPHPSLLAFDAPSREEHVLERITSNTPLQALDLLNDPIFVEAARSFAAAAIKEGGSGTNRRLQWAFLRAVGRPAEQSELRTLAALYNSGIERFRVSVADAEKLVAVGAAPVARGMPLTELAAMTGVTRALLSLHEMITRD
jgi:hypothetical protein